MNCTACGTPLLADARFCAHCGTPVRLACQSCGTALPPGLNFCPHCGTSVAAPPSSADVALTPVAERRVTSVLFGDLVGFTTLSESRDPEEVRELLSRYFDTARAIVARYGGTIEKFIGDAVMAVWGVPSAHEDDAERAVRAGLDIADSVAEFGASVGAPGLAMRVGVVTGEVAVTLGATGEGMVAGDAVNTAARVQAKAEPGSVWVDGTTRSLAGGSIDFADAGWHELKGKAEPVELFAATAVMGGIGGERSSDRVQALLVGRRRELSMLKEMFHVAAEEGRPRLVVLSGDAGVGKTRLGRELENYLDGLSTEVLWHSGRCLAYGDGVAFSALTAAVRGRIGAGEDDAEAGVRAKLMDSLESYVPDAEERARLLPALTNLLGLTDSARGLTRADLFSAWLTWFERLSQRDGDAVVWVVDDAHHADEGFLDFVEHVSAVAQVPMLVVLLARPELLVRRPALAALRRANVIGLETLSANDIAGLFDVLVEGLPSDVRDALVRRAEGNPLFAIETVRALHDQGLAVDGPTRHPGAVRLAPDVDVAALAALAAPASLQVLVASRLDLLPPRERSVLAAASVLGQTFSRTALAALTGLPEDELAAGLRELVGRDLLTTVTDRLSAEEGQHAFVQTVVRTVAYQTQSRRDRLRRHLAVVEHLRPLADADRGLSTVLAQHLRDAVAMLGADDPQRPELTTQLGGWLERSAERSVAVGAPGDALRSLEEALTFAVEPADTVRLHLAAADAALAAGAYAEASEHALPLAAEGASIAVDAAAHATFAAAHALRMLGRQDDGWALLQRYLPAGAPEGVPPRIAATLVRQIAVYMSQFARFDESTRWMLRALSLAEDAGDPRDIAHAMNAFATDILIQGHNRIGSVLLDLAAEFAGQHGLAWERAMPLGNKLAFGINHDPDAALAAGDEAMRLFEQIGNVAMVWHTAMNKAILFTLTGHWDDVAKLRDRPLLRERPAAPAVASIMEYESAVIALARGEELDLARIDELASLGEVGQIESSDDVYYAALRAVHTRSAATPAEQTAAGRRMVEMVFRHCGLGDDFPHLWSAVVGWAVESGDLGAARELLRMVGDVPPTRLSPLLRAQLPRLRGTIEAADPASTADPDTIEQDLLAGIAGLDELGMAPDHGRAQATLGVWLTGQGRGAHAGPHLAAARDTFTQLRATAWLRELDAALSLSAAG